jgi:SAM-dependent methyltransferase
MPQPEVASWPARSLLAERFITGQGIEIGAAHMPTHLPAGAVVTYVDMVSTQDLRRLWPEVADLDLVNVSIVDDAERLAKIPPASQDFIIANHFLEHCLDPIGALITFHDRLRDGGVLYAAVPDKRHTFDVDRPVTPYEHLLEEHQAGDRRFIHDHTREYAELAERYQGDLDARAQEIVDSAYRIHYHVWTYAEILELAVNTIRQFNLAFELECAMASGNELILILRKPRPEGNS